MESWRNIIVWFCSNSNRKLIFKWIYVSSTRERNVLFNNWTGQDATCETDSCSSTFTCRRHPSTGPSLWESQPPSLFMSLRPIGLVIGVWFFACPTMTRVLSANTMDNELVLSFSLCKMICYFIILLYLHFNNQTVRGRLEKKPFAVSSPSNWPLSLWAMGPCWPVHLTDCPMSSWSVWALHVQ